MTRPKFEKFINDYRLVMDKNMSAMKLGIDLTDYEDDYHQMIENLGSHLFSEEGWEWIQWFALETDFQTRKEKYEAYDKDGSIICQDVDGLYDYLVKEKYISVTEEK